MDKRIEILVEGILYNATRAFLELEDKEKGKELLKKYVLEFCKEYDANLDEVMTKLKKMLENSRYEKDFNIEFD